MVLRPLHTFGRHPDSCRTVLQEADISKLHALVRWSGTRWELCDQSRNGTLLDGQRLAPAQWHGLQVGSEIRFGASSAGAWSLIDASAPRTGLWPPGGEGVLRVLDAQENLLPNPSQADSNVFQLEGRWWWDRMDRVVPLLDGHIVQAGSQRWEFILCEDLGITQDLPRTPPVSASPAAVFDFHLSQNEEHVNLDIHLEGRDLPLGERIHHYTLATLARHRLQDARRGLPPPSQGWLGIEDLARMLGVDVPHLNIQLFRARRQIQNALGIARDTVVERRRGEVRFGDHAFRIRKCGLPEGELLAPVL
ncbi:FHA domain protein [Paracidovorax anthurii]|uniref:FHA domain protein n=2 Tax=Paracidovorax anthurii TaxID=78229 RepID=A0A328Z075_9BURK|nr:FHA domain-containing protein [Paracidovorax anthurii]RAR79144.1 FHA domain protein [Paracidovorax anthurii]